MKLHWNQEDMQSGRRCVLLTDGLGGYCSVTDGFGINRCDQGILVASVQTPTVRVTTVHRLREILRIGDREEILSHQQFADGTEEGGEALQEFSCEKLPVWNYETNGIEIERTCAMAQGENRTAVIYTIENHVESDCSLSVEPMMKFGPKELPLTEMQELTLEGRLIRSGDYRMWIHTDGEIAEAAPRWETLAYPEDEKDGRPARPLPGRPSFSSSGYARVSHLGAASAISPSV